MDDSHLCKRKTDYFRSCCVLSNLGQFFPGAKRGHNKNFEKKSLPKDCYDRHDQSHNTLTWRHTGSIYLSTTFRRTKGIATKMMLWPDVSWYLTLQPISFLFHILLKDSLKKSFRNDQLGTILISIKGGMWGVIGSHGSRLPVFGYYRTLPEVMFETETR